MENVILNSSPDGWGLRVVENGERRVLCVDNAGEARVSSVAHLRDVIWNYRCTSLVIPARIARYVVVGLRACAACIADKYDCALKGTLNDPSSLVGEIFPLSCWFHIIAATPPGSDGRITFDTTPMFGDGPPGPEELRSGTYDDPLMGGQLELLTCLEFETDVPWGRDRGFQLEFSQAGGMSVSALEKLQRGLNFGPRTIIFPSRQVPIDVFVSLLWAGKFMYAYAENDPRTPMIITSLCMLSFAFARGKIARSDRIVISGLPRQLDWPHGGNWRQPDDVLRVGELILQQIRRDLTEIANG